MQLTPGRTVIRSFDGNGPESMQLTPGRAVIQSVGGVQQENESEVELLKRMLLVEQEKIARLQRQLEEAKRKEAEELAAKQCVQDQQEQQISLKLEVNALRAQLRSQHFSRGVTKKRKLRKDAGTKKGQYGIPHDDEQRKARLQTLGLSEEQAQKVILQVTEEEEERAELSAAVAATHAASGVPTVAEGLVEGNHPDEGVASNLTELGLSLNNADVNLMNSQQLMMPSLGGIQLSSLVMPEYPVPPHLQSHVAPSLLPATSNESSLGLTLNMADMPLKLPADRSTVMSASSVAKLQRKRGPKGKRLLRKPKCEQADCFKTPGFGFERFKPRFCKAHMLPGMHNVMSQRCENHACHVRPSFGFEGEKPRFCEKHRMMGMVNVKSPKCHDPNCVKQANFGFPHSPDTRRFCGKHKLEGMANTSIPATYCIVEGCKNIRRCGLPNGKRMYCKLHRQEDMVRMDWAACMVPKCMNDACCGYPDTKKKEACEDHRAPGMVDLRPPKKIKKKKEPKGDQEEAQRQKEALAERKQMKQANGLCVYDEKCLGIGKYSKTNGKYLACELHKQEGMTLWESCIATGCHKKAIYGIEDSHSQTHCNEHKLEGMKSFKQPKKKRMKNESIESVKEGIASSDLHINDERIMCMHASENVQGSMAEEATAKRQVKGTTKKRKRILKDHKGFDNQTGNSHILGKECDNEQSKKNSESFDLNSGKQDDGCKLKKKKKSKKKRKEKQPLESYFL